MYFRYTKQRENKIKNLDVVYKNVMNDILDCTKIPKFRYIHFIVSYYDFLRRDNWRKNKSLDLKAQNW